MKLIETKTLTTAAASIEFTSIPQTFTDLVFKVSSRNTSTSTTPICFVSFNGSTADFTARQLLGNGSSVSSNNYTSGRILFNSQAVYTADTFGDAEIYIPNYAGSTNKSYSSDSVSENNLTTSFQGLIAGLWSQTAAITSVDIGPNAPDFAIGTTISLYGILKGSDGITTAS
jgi:hypothetical protein